MVGCGYQSAVLDPLERRNSREDNFLLIMRRDAALAPWECETRVIGADDRWPRAVPACPGGLYREAPRPQATERWCLRASECALRVAKRRKFSSSQYLGATEVECQNGEIQHRGPYTPSGLRASFWMSPASNAI